MRTVEPPLFLDKLPQTGKSVGRDVAPRHQFPEHFIHLGGEHLRLPHEVGGEHGPLSR